jgi:hypothetical protein
MPSKNNKAKGGPLGGVIGGGRPTKSRQLKNYDIALKLLDDNIEKALNVLISGLEATKDLYTKDGQFIATVPDNYYRFNCATVLVKKVLPDKKTKEITGPGGTALPPSTVIDRRKIVMNIVQNLDEMDLDDVKEMQQNGDFKLLRKNIDYVLEQEEEELEEDAQRRISDDVGRTTETEEEGEMEAEEDLN